MNDNEVWAAVDDRRAALADVLAGASPEQWRHPSLCEGWTVRDVAAHLTMPLLSTGELLRLAMRYPGSTNRLIRDGSIALAARYSTDEIVARLRRLVGYHKPFPGLTCREALIDVVGHTLDIAIPLGLPVQLPPEQVAEAARHVWSYGGSRKSKVFKKLPYGGLRLSATDTAWSVGEGASVEGSMTDLFLVLTGRPAGLPGLRGAGTAQLAAHAG
ncbi:maleylpyruvate isomerase family mycothiol-dependent enzyme [Cumulibacter manganitolerans]|uniref:maleylpyruvate isomerase family mycothiol-dependent enzyme n=1 Tax=Cumulibacter manganitolerans TaxID=1884992 RepID=UPI001296A264|nr:maleylpyruvate isomerase family mycothiol-dependent enzyme [Cumulibacter manganitolerans]